MQTFVKQTFAQSIVILHQFFVTNQEIATDVNE